jgi:hypothetical protein
MFVSQKHSDGVTMQHALTEARAYAFRQKALQADAKAARTETSDTTRRAWLIVARDWYRMAEQEETKLAQKHIEQLIARLRRISFS